MGLFGRKKKAADGAPAPQGGETILVLGSGCARCNALEQAVRQALDELGREPAVGHVTDFAQIAAYGVMTTPALVVNGRVVCSGRVPGAEEVKRLLQQEENA